MHIYIKKLRPNNRRKVRYCIIAENDCRLHQLLKFRTHEKATVFLVRMKLAMGIHNPVGGKWTVWELTKLVVGMI